LLVLSAPQGCAPPRCQQKEKSGPAHSRNPLRPIPYPHAAEPAAGAPGSVPPEKSREPSGNAPGPAGSPLRDPRGRRCKGWKPLAHAMFLAVTARPSQARTVVPGKETRLGRGRAGGLRSQRNECSGRSISDPPASHPDRPAAFDSKPGSAHLVPRVTRKPGLETR